MNTWAVQDAKARFSELLDACVENGPQMVTRRGAETAVLVPLAEWKLLNSQRRPTIKDVLMTDFARTENLAPPRQPARSRPIPTFD
jgi:antitoxin Phd